MRPVVLVPSRRCLGGRLSGSRSLIGREDNPASDALVRPACPCSLFGAEKLVPEGKGTPRTSLWDRGPGIQLAIRLGEGRMVGWAVEVSRGRAKEEKTGLRA